MSATSAIFRREQIQVKNRYALLHGVSQRTFFHVFGRLLKSQYFCTQKCGKFACFAVYSRRRVRDMFERRTPFRRQRNRKRGRDLRHGEKLPRLRQQSMATDVRNFGNFSTRANPSQKQICSITRSFAKDFLSRIRKTA